MDARLVCFMFSTDIYIRNSQLFLYSPYHSVVLRPYLSHTQIAHRRHILVMWIAVQKKVCILVSSLVCLGAVFHPGSQIFPDQEWKHRCYMTCLSPVLDAISKPQLLYDTVLDLDKQIRDFSIPAVLRNKDVHSRSIVMQRASLSTALEAGMHFPHSLTCRCKN